MSNINQSAPKWALFGLFLSLSIASTGAPEPITADKATNSAQGSATALPAKPLTFNVWLDARPMGKHRYEFTGTAERFTVRSTADFNVKLVFVTVFDYQHEAQESWTGNCLTAITSNTKTNGEAEELVLEIPADQCAGTYTYWDKERLLRPALTNAQTGEIEDATARRLGPKPLPSIGNRKSVRPATTSASTLSLQTASASFELYYNAADELLMMQTENDGRTITYLHDSLSAR